MRWTPGSSPRDPLALGVRCVKGLPPRRLTWGKALARSGPGRGGESETSPHWQGSVGIRGEGPCVLGCPGSHLTSQSGNYSEENAFRVETLLASVPVAKSVCHPSPQFLLFFYHLILCKNIWGLPPQHSRLFGILHKTLNLSAIKSK